MKVVTVVGARPQFVKAAAVSKAFARASGVTEVLVHTGQHFDADMSDVFFDELGIPPAAHNLGISGGGHGAMTGRMLEAIEGVLIAEKPDRMLVYGDTNSTVAGALAAAKLHIPVAHVEAGLRSFNRRMPEEINRVVTDHLSDLLFCPTFRSVENLATEGVVKGVHHVGDVMYDVALLARDIASRSSRIRETLELSEGRYMVATIHRAENTDDPRRLSDVFTYLRERAREHDVVLPLHPRTKAALRRDGLSTEGLKICSPLGYVDMTWLVAGAAGVMTDSGGLQKEAYFHGKPCVTLRDETEWVETVESGWNRLWKDDLVEKPRTDIADYGKGDASEKIVSLLMA
jgi:UDP-GlcNAc3NAcA epimerase